MFRWQDNVKMGQKINRLWMGFIVLRMGTSTFLQTEDELCACVTDLRKSHYMVFTEMLQL
jgi:hypothetical protein